MPDLPDKSAVRAEVLGARRARPAADRDADDAQLVRHALALATSARPGRRVRAAAVRAGRAGARPGAVGRGGATCCCRSCCPIATSTGPATTGRSPRAPRCSGSPSPPAPGWARPPSPGSTSCSYRRSRSIHRGVRAGPGRRLVRPRPGPGATGYAGGGAALRRTSCAPACRPHPHDRPVTGGAHPDRPAPGLTCHGHVWVTSAGRSARDAPRLALDVSECQHC